MTMKNYENVQNKGGMQWTIGNKAWNKTESK